MFTQNVLIHYTDQSAGLEGPDSPPKRRFTTAWIGRYRGRLRVHGTVIGPESQQSQYHLTLRDTKAQRMTEAITDLVKALEEEIRRKDSA